jgi:hypothetical protein
VPDAGLGVELGDGADGLESAEGFESAALDSADLDSAGFDSPGEEADSVAGLSALSLDADLDA